MAMENCTEPPALDAAAEAKARGNSLYKVGDFEGAYEAYSECISLDDSSAVFYSNRAAAALALQRFRDAASDAMLALRLDPELVKCYGRGAKALARLGDLGEAAAMAATGVAACQKKAAFANEQRGLEAQKKALEAHAELHGQATQRLTSGDAAGALASIETLMAEIVPELSLSDREGTRSRMLGATALGGAPRQWQLMRGTALLALRDCAEALQAANAVLRMDGTASNFVTLRVQALMLRDSHSLQNLVGVLGNALALDPDHVLSRLLVRRLRALDRLKTAGNEAFKNQDYAEAERLYGEWLELDASLDSGLTADVLQWIHARGGVARAKVLSNRAVVASRLGRIDSVIADSSAALAALAEVAAPHRDAGHELAAVEIQQQRESQLFLKLYLRRADALFKQATAEHDDPIEAERLWDACVRDYQICEALDRGSAEIRRGLRVAKQHLQRAKKRDYYKILGLERGASDAAIKKSYRRMALVHHPDKLVGMSDEQKLVSERRFKAVSEAYSVLSDPRKKQMVDMGMDVDGNSASAGDGMSGGGISQADILNMFMRSQGGGGGFGVHDEFLNSYMYRSR